MLYLIGLGLSEKSISLEGMEKIRKCRKIYIENYTVEFPYSLEELEKTIGKKIIPADRNLVESMNEIIGEAKKQDIAILVYGSPLTATTHITLIQEAKKQGVKCEIIYNASIFDAVAETGLQLYKFGKIASIPNFEAHSFMEIIRENQKINSHSLILVDINLQLQDAIDILEKLMKKYKVDIDKIIVCERLGTSDNKIYYDIINNLKDKNIKPPFCFIIPSKLHFMEEEVLKKYS